MARYYMRGGAGWIIALLALLINSPTRAHDPVFGIGPHVLYKGGVEAATEVHLGEAGDERELELGLELVYGITGDWAAGIELPYAWKEEGAAVLLELNGEYGRHAELNGTELPNSGGTEWFLSPGIFWTKRNFVVKAGVQIPIASDLNGHQDETDYRAKLVLEWHL